MLIDATGGSIIQSNTFNDEVVSTNGSIAIVESDDVTISKNNFKNNNGISGFSLPSLETVGAYEIAFSTNVTINKEKHNKSNLLGCQILGRPFVDSSNDFSSKLIQCAVSQ